MVFERRTLLITVLIALSISSFGQKRLLAKANDQFNNFEYSKAVETYKKLLEKNPANSYVLFKVADSYMKMRKYSEAIHYYSELVQIKGCNPDHYYTYSRLLLNDSTLRESKKWLSKYIQSSGDDPVIRSYFDNWIEFEDLWNEKSAFIISNIDGNTEFSDMCPVLFGDRIIFTSSRIMPGEKKKIYKWTNEPFSTPYITTIDKTGNFLNVEPFPVEYPSKYGISDIYVDTVRDVIYFTANNLLEKDYTLEKEKIFHLNIYSVPLHESIKGSYKLLPINHQNFSTGHPYLSPDMGTLYFVSNRPGGEGGSDIYKSVYNEHGWGEPENLGPEINTRGDEMYPSVDVYNNLYFSSDGRNSMGGMDIYAAFVDENQEISVINPGSPLNSPFDDFGFIIDQKNKTGFLTSNRTGGKGSDDIYSFHSVEKFITLIPIDSINGDTLKGSLELRELLTKNYIVGYSPDIDSITIKPFSNYKYEIRKEGYYPATLEISTNFFTDLGHVKVNLMPNFFFTGIVKDQVNGNRLPLSRVAISSGSKDIIDVKSDSAGEFSFRYDPELNYSMEIFNEGYYTGVYEMSAETILPENAPVDIFLMRIDIASMAGETIYFEFDNYSISQDFEKMLNKLVSFMENFPDAQIEVHGHADSRGSEQYNLKLTERRAESIVKYLTGKGIDKKRLHSKGFGESKPLNKCIDGVKCPESLHRINRRAEIILMNRF